MDLPSVQAGDTGRRERLKRALEKFGTLAWMRSPVERHPIYGYRQVSFVSWRYNAPSDPVKEYFDSFIHSTPVHLPWQFKAARNWTIAPARLLTEAGPTGENFNGAALSITEHDQDFCALAEEDLMQILLALEQAPRE